MTGFFMAGRLSGHSAAANPTLGTYGAEAFGINNSWPGAQTLQSEAGYIDA
jgi:hypothetical protein